MVIKVAILLRGKHLGPRFQGLFYVAVKDLLGLIFQVFFESKVATASTCCLFNFFQRIPSYSRQWSEIKGNRSLTLWNLVLHRFWTKVAFFFAFIVRFLGNAELCKQEDCTGGSTLHPLRKAFAFPHSPIFDLSTVPSSQIASWRQSKPCR